MSLKNVILKLSITILFLSLSVYILFVQTEKYESSTIISIKDLSQEQSISSFGSLLLGASSETSQDASLLQLYIESGEMYTLLDKEFNLTAYYTGEELDMFSRLSNKLLLPMFEVNQKNLIAMYNADLVVLYDEVSGTLEISFAHANPKLAKKILESIIAYGSKVLNGFDRENSQIVLAFLEKEENLKYQRFTESIKNLLTYQNQHKTIDPKIDVESKNTILANLEAEVVQKSVEYNNKQQYLNSNSPEMKILNSSIKHLKQSIVEIKKKIVGTQNNKELNSNVSDFELLQSKVEFNKQLYVHTLTKLEEVKMNISKNSKNLIVVSHPYIPDSYTYPTKLNNILTLLIVLLFVYGVGVMIIHIIKDHKD